MYELQTHYLDVGQGDCSLIIVKDSSIPENNSSEFDPQIVRTVLIDCGSREGGQKAADALLGQLLKSRVKKIDVVIITHFDEDHYNGFKMILQYACPKNLLYINYFIGSKIYDQGFLYHYDTYNQKKKVISNTGLKPETSYGNYLYFLHETKEIHKMERVSERIYCGVPSYFEKGRPKNAYKKMQPKNNQRNTFRVNNNIWTPLKEIGSEAPDKDSLCSVQFNPCHKLLGKDLMNEGFNESLPIHLYCLSVNGWVPKKGNLKKIGYEHGDKNKFSISTLLTDGKYASFFGGDLESEQEDELIERIKQYSPYGLSVLKTSHHCAKKTTSSLFLSELQPSLVTVSCGETGTFNHPSVDTLKRIKKEDSVKKVIICGFGVKQKKWEEGDAGDEEEENRKYAQECHKALKEYTDVGVPTHYTSIYKKTDKFFISGASWLGEPGGITVYYDSKNDSEPISFTFNFFHGFYSFSIEGKKLELDNSMCIDRLFDDEDQETHEVVFDDILNIEFIRPVARKRKREDTEEERLVDPHGRTVIITEGGSVQEIIKKRKRE